MRLPTMARSRISLVAALASSVLAGACANDATAPAPPALNVSQEASSAFVPSAASKSLVGVSDGTYQFTVSPNRAASLVLGANMLAIPANAICDLSSSSYGASYWDDKCAPEKKPVTITAIVRNASSSHPSIDFYPALRFSPKANVMLYFYVPNKADQYKSLWTVSYCSDHHVCVDESLLDPTLQTYFDPTTKVVFRRIKHFSGYLVNYAVDTASALAPF